MRKSLVFLAIIIMFGTSFMFFHLFSGLVDKYGHCFLSFMGDGCEFKEFEGFISGAFLLIIYVVAVAFLIYVIIKLMFKKESPLEKMKLEPIKLEYLNIYTRK